MDSKSLFVQYGIKDSVKNPQLFPEFQLNFK